MFVAIVDFRVEATARVSVLGILRKYAEVSRAMPGNPSYRVFADGESSGMGGTSRVVVGERAHGGGIRGR